MYNTDLERGDALRLRGVNGHTGEVFSAKVVSVVAFVGEDLIVLQPHGGSDQRIFLGQVDEGSGRWLFARLGTRKASFVANRHERRRAGRAVL